MVETETKIQRYDSYKDSGVEWLGDIPEHWKVGKLKSFLEVFGRIGFRGYTTNDLVDEGSGAITISPSNFGESNLEWTKNSYLSWDKYYESPEIMVEVGDLLIVKTASIGKIAHVRELPEKATVNPQILVVKNVKADNRFLFYQFLSIVFQTQLMKEKIGSTIYTISENKILNGFALLPPLPEQTAIAQFLDDKTTKIDQAIAIKQQQIALLKERKQILIHKAVTRGLDDSVALKDSGVEWIGEIPEHWGIEKGKWLFIQNKRPVRKSDEVVTCFRDGEVTLRKNRKTDGFTNSLKEHGYQGIRKGDLVIHNMDAFAGAIGVSDSDGKSTPVYSVCTPRQLNVVEPFYYALYLRELARTGFILSLAKGIRERSSDFRFNDFANLLFPLPTKFEQKQIVIYAENITKKIETAISLKEQEISKLQEYKSSLINSVVTGKVRVC